MIDGERKGEHHIQVYKKLHSTDLKPVSGSSQKRENSVASQNLRQLILFLFY